LLASFERCSTMIHLSIDPIIVCADRACDAASNGSAAPLA
jgi:hypothetical protein